MNHSINTNESAKNLKGCIEANVVFSLYHHTVVHTDNDFTTDLMLYVALSDKGAVSTVQWAR